MLSIYFLTLSDIYFNFMQLLGDNVNSATPPHHLWKTRNVKESSTDCRTRWFGLLTVGAESVLRKNAETLQQITKYSSSSATFEPFSHLYIERQSSFEPCSVATSTINTNGLSTDVIYLLSGLLHAGWSKGQDTRFSFSANVSNQSKELCDV